MFVNPKASKSNLYECDSMSNGLEAIWLIHEVDALAEHDEMKLFIQMFWISISSKGFILSHDGFFILRTSALTTNVDKDVVCCLFVCFLSQFLLHFVISLHLPLRALLLAYGLVSSYVLWIQINLYFAFLSFFIALFVDAHLSTELFLSIYVLCTYCFICFHHQSHSLLSNSTFC